MTNGASRNKVILWQILFIVSATTWLFAPVLNKTLSYKTTLISQYETFGQPFSLFFRLGDVLAGVLLTTLAIYYLKRKAKPMAGYLLLIIGVGMVLDPLVATTCRMQGLQCVEYVSAGFLFHAVETVVTASSIFILAAYDIMKRKRLVSIVFIIFQIVYLGLFASQYAEHHHFNTITQYLYQLFSVIWIAWFARDFFVTPARQHLIKQKTTLIRYIVGVWALLNGVLAIILSLSDIQLLGRVRGIYFASDTAWLAQHGVIVGVVMLYLSRHLMRGERRARQVFLSLVGIEVLKYSLITPHAALLALYIATFCILFAIPDQFNRGTKYITWEIRIKDLYYMVIALLLTTLLVLAILDRDSKFSIITTRSFTHFNEYALHSDRVHKTHIKSVLLADTTTAFILMSIGTVLWILFRPYKSSVFEFQDLPKVKECLIDFSNSSEDYFKLWPHDKQYFWNEDRSGFIAYKIVGSVAFALADPITNKSQQRQLINEFKGWCQAGRLRVCFLPIVEQQRDLYKGLNSVQIGANALINSENFLQHTSRDKWWRWKRNRAVKQGYNYQQHVIPHSTSFIEELRTVSNAWLAIDDHQERGFAMGHFSESYLQDCTIHTLHDQTGKIVAFANQLPLFRANHSATIDLLRYVPEAGDSMPFLLFNIIEATHIDGYKFFDLGFVPFAGTKGPLLSIARALSADKFSYQGLEQFKNKFDPSWQQNYLAYDGDLGDLLTVAANLENALKLSNKNDISDS